MLFCKHDWQVKSEAILPSALEEMKRLDFSPEKLCLAACERRHVCILACSKCGKIRKYSTGTVGG